MQTPIILGGLALLAALAPGVGAAPLSTVRVPLRFPIPVQCSVKLSAKELHVGSDVPLLVSQDVRCEGCLVLRRGTPVRGIVSSTQQTGPVGRPSLILVTIETTVAEAGTVIPLSGSLSATGEDRMMEAVGAGVGVCCLGIFVPGGRKDIAKGVGTIAFTAAPVELPCIQ